MNLPVKKFADKKFSRPLVAIVGVAILVVLITKFLPWLAGTILCLLLLGGYYFVIYRSLTFCNVNFREILINDWPRILIVAALATGFIVFMINSTHTIYTSDSLETWEPAIYCEQVTFTDPYRAIKELRWSINHLDYNNFLPMLIALPMHIFGKSFLCYELYVWIMFALPAIFIAAATFKTIFENAGVRLFPCSALMTIILLFPAFEIPIFIGYANVSILLPGAVIFAMLLSLNKSQLQRDRLIFLALLCICAVFQARTAVYMLIGIFSGYTLYIIVSGFQERALLADLVMLLKKYFFLGAAILVMILPLFFTFVKHALTYDIGTAYSAYGHGYDFSQRFYFHMGYLGYLTYILFALGAIVSLFSRKFSALTIFLLAWTIIPPLLICKVQLMDRQHFYTIILPFAFTIALLIAFASARKKIIGVALSLFLMINFVQPYSENYNLGGILNQEYFLPVRHDIDDFKKFVSDMDNLAGADKKIYALTSNGLYNGHSFTKLYLPEKDNALPALMNIAEVDLREGFPIHFFDADFVIVSDPLQIHLREQDQSVVVKLAEVMTNSTPISKHFKKIREYTFRPETQGVSSVTFKVYEKISPFEKSDIDYVEKIFVELYPNQDELFKNRFEAYKHEHFKD